MSSKSNFAQTNGDLVKHEGQVCLAERKKLLAQHPLTVWFTGLSASGKSTLAYALERRLVDAGYKCFVLDGDNIRHGLNKDLGFSHQDRTENIRRVSEVARLMNESGLVVLTAFISPYLHDRKMAKKIIGEERFVEVYLNTPLEACELRDPKGLYKRARTGTLLNFTGIHDQYEVSTRCEFIIDTSIVVTHDAIERLMLAIIPRISIGNHILPKNEGDCDDL